MKNESSDKNKAFVREAFETLFNKRDYAAAERFWSPDYIQHSAHIEPGRDGLFRLIKSLPPALKYESTLIVGEGDYVLLHGRYSGTGLPVNWVVVDIVRLEDGKLKEHWDVIEDEASRASSKSGMPTLEEHQRIIAAEVNPERKTLYQLCWHLGASQGDIASLKVEDVDWTNGTVSFTRKKTGMPVLVHLGGEALNLFKDLPGEGPLFPYLSRVRAGDRATEFASRCRQLEIIGVTLHSYRYAWAERAKTVGYPERFAQEALGHNSKAVHRAYAKRALMKIPSLEDYEQRAAKKVAPAV